MTALLQAKALSVSRGERVLFRDLELVVNEGDRLGLVGHNGSGKTTLLKLLAGELEPEAGEIVRRRGLRLAAVEQFLPERLERISLVDAVAEQAAPREAWRAPALLSALDFTDADLARPTAAFSGGQQNRLMLARALVAEPELLLLDEPTNHLDLATLLSFETLLADFRGAVVLVSHDRDFLDAVTNSTCVLRDARSYRFAAGFTSAMAELDAMDAAHAKTRAAEDRKIDALRASAKRLAQWGKVYDNEKLARRARSMERRVERLEEDRTFVTGGSPLELDLQLETSRSRQALAIEGLTVAVPGRVLYRVDELVLRPGERVALLGANGTGKSTLIRILMAAYADGAQGAQIRFSPQSRIGYYDQELDEVAGGEDMLAFACRRVTVPEQQVRNRLISAGFPHAEHGKRVDALSGGERARLLFVVHALNSPNFLILDEPTNHIDIAGKEQLEAQLLDSGATLLITSHDRRFLTRVAGRFLLITDGRLVELPSPEPFFRAEGGRADAARSVPRGAAVPAALGDGSSAAQESDALLERIVELEDKLERDRQRKARFQKPKLQAEWQREIDALYAALEERSGDP